MSKNITRHRYQLRSTQLISAVAALALLLAASCAPSPKTEVTKNLSADEVLRGMSETLARAQQLTFKVSRKMDAALVEGSQLPESAQIEIAVERPNKVTAKSTSEEGVRRFYADGQTVSLFDENMKLYASIPSAGTIDETVARIDARYGFTPPLAEFTLNDPYKKFSQQIESSSYVGIESVNGVDCHHVKATGKLADTDLWIAGNDHLPRRLIATFKDREGSPKLTADFSDWNLSATLADTAFSFVPPKDAEKTEMIATGQELAKDERQGEKKQEKQK